RLALPEMSWLKDKIMADDRLKRIKNLDEIANELGVSMAELSIGWCIKNPHVTTAILGATKKQQLLDNLKAIDTMNMLTPEILVKIDDIMQTKPKPVEF
ncbi:MAG: aldo/keto reductase, partial [Ginsengibacter sp.]